MLTIYKALSGGNRQRSSGRADGGYLPKDWLTCNDPSTGFCWNCHRNVFRCAAPQHRAVDFHHFNLVGRCARKRLPVKVFGDFTDVANRTDQLYCSDRYTGAWLFNDARSCGSFDERSRTRAVTAITPQVTAKVAKRILPANKPANQEAAPVVARERMSAVRDDGFLICSICRSS